MATVNTSQLLVAHLEDQVRELRVALEDAAEAICRLDLKGRFVSVNRAFSVMVGQGAGDLLGRSWEQAVAPPDRAAIWADLHGGAVERVEREVRGLRKDGSEFPMQMAIVPLRGGHYLFMRDLSERRRMEEQLVFAGRMAAVGTLAAGVAHEINNPLAYIAANIDFSRLQLGTLAGQPWPAQGGAGDVSRSLEEVQEALGEARQGAERVRNIVRDLKVFGRGDEDAHGPVALRRVLDSSINMAWNEIRHRARIVKDYAEAPLVDGNESRLGQVFLNLLLNAAQAIPEGETDRNEIRVSTRTDGAGNAVIEMRDTGRGIPDEIVARIFDPFFTTKPAGEGTGLGLWICRGILSGLRGTIAVESEVGRGSLFRVTLPPAAVETSGDDEDDGDELVVEQSGGRVLIIDDEPMFLGALRRALQADYRLTCLTDGREALQRLREGERFDAVLCDLMMPELNGMDLHTELAQSAPDQLERMIFVTGGAFTPKAREFLDRVPNARVEKPIDLQNLRVLLRNFVR